MRNEFTIPGETYAINVETYNQGIPYADSFYVTSNFNLIKVSKSEARLTVMSNIKYKKTVWGFVKGTWQSKGKEKGSVTGGKINLFLLGLIEKNTWTGLDDFYSSMTKALAADIVTEKANQLGDVNAANAGKNAVNGAGARSATSLKKSGAKNSKTLESTRRKGNNV